MSEKKVFAVVPVGLSDPEQRALKNIFKLSQHRPRTYELREGGMRAEADVLLVDADNPAAIASWRTFRGQHRDNAAIPYVMVSKDAPDAKHRYSVHRPFVATRVLGVLDKLAIQELDAGSKRTISDGDAPTIDAQEIAALQEKVRAATPTSDSGRIFRALVIDDSPSVRKQISLELSLLSISAEFAETGEEALVRVEQASYDLIFLDVMLPGVDGYKVCKTIKRSKQAKDTPVIMLTGKSGTFDRIRGTMAGCDTYLTKPVDQAAFRKAVKKYLGTL